MAIISVITPCHNCENTLSQSVESLQAQTLLQDDLEIILVNDGSADDTLRVCRELAASDPRIVVIDKPNGGVGSARNAGIEAARGRYIAFLDSDDTLLPETLEAAVRFFDEHYDEIDLVTYPMRLYNEQREWPHVREQVLTETGVYDLTKLQNAFALITNVNVVVKNDDALPRFREDLLIHEDELFFMTVLLRKLKVGFSKCGAYRYQQLGSSAIATKMHPFYQFEKNISFWEELFAAYSGKAPLYLQASFLNEVNWKIRKDVLFPYHYEGEDFERAANRIRALMDRVDDDVIFTSPRSDEYYRHYLASLKTRAALSCELTDAGFVLRNGAQSLLCRNHVEVDIVRTRVAHRKLRITGILRSVLFEHVEKPTFSLEVYSGKPVLIPLERTSHDFHEGHTRTNRFWKFQTDIPLEEDAVASFSLFVENRRIPLRLVFSSKANLDTKNDISSFFAAGFLIQADSSHQGLAIKRQPYALTKATHWLRNTQSVARRNKKALAMRIPLAFKNHGGKPLWLYYDRQGVGGGNAYLQFLHDIQKSDGVERRYITKDPDEAVRTLFDDEQRKLVVKFASPQHRFLHLEADLIIASYVERSNWCPFALNTMRGLADLVHYDLVYLQHGVLHAHMPWKYSADHLLIDFEVISTHFEQSNLVYEYGFREDQLISSGMPRYDTMSLSAPSQKKILFAPSWRKYLVTELPGLAFEAKPAAFRASIFWRETKRFLKSEDLVDMLERYDYTLDIKLHPIFSAYKGEFEDLISDRISIIDSARESNYRVFVTDFSSWSFDFAYLKRAIAYFLPDEQEFHAGLNGYRKLDLSLEEAFGPLAKSSEELITNLENILQRDGKPASPYIERMDGFFLHYDDKQRDRLYEALTNLP